MVTLGYKHGPGVKASSVEERERGLAEVAAAQDAGEPGQLFVLQDAQQAENAWKFGFDHGRAFYTGAPGLAMPCGGAAEDCRRKLWKHPIGARTLAANRAAAWSPGLRRYSRGPLGARYPTRRHAGTDIETTLHWRNASRADDGAVVSRLSARPARFTSRRNFSLRPWRVLCFSRSRSRVSLKNANL